MDKKELHIIALSKSESSKDNYVLVLEERKGFRRVPIIIGPFEAQAIAIGLENMKTNRPLTHDLLLTSIEQGGQILQEIIISDYTKEVFHAQLIVRRADRTTYILDARSSDAIALAIRKPCPIYTSEKILQEAGLVLDHPGESFGEKRRSLQNYSVEELEALLQKVLKKEDYESAKRIRDILNQKKADK
ncbi:MAG: bifunctional nuclease family protein [Bacteroidota bacterium]